MTTSQTYLEGQCGKRVLRSKVWASGFSLKCQTIKKTLVGRPFISESFDSSEAVV